MQSHDRRLTYCTATIPRLGFKYSNAAAAAICALHPPVGRTGIRRRSALRFLLDELQSTSRYNSVVLQKLIERGMLRDNAAVCFTVYCVT